MNKSTSRLLLFACFWVFILVFGLPLSAAPSDPGEARAEWMSGFVKLEAADQSVNENNVLAALPLYKEALEIFEGVRRKYPQWNPSLLNYRINYCQQNIEKLESRVQSQSSALSREDLLVLQAKQAKELQTLQEEKRELGGKVEVLTASLERARQEAAKTAGQDTALADLAAAKTNLEQKNGLLELRLREALAENEKIKDQAKFKDDATRLNNELTRLQNQYRQVQAEGATLREERENLTAKNTELTRQLEWQQRQQKEQETSLKVARELADTRKTENDNLMLRLAGAEAKKELAEKTLADNTKEQQRLAGQQENVTRELSELRRIREQHAENQKTLLLGQELLAAARHENDVLRRLVPPEQLEKLIRDGITVPEGSKLPGEANLMVAIEDEPSERDEEISRLHGEIKRLQAQKPTGNELQAGTPLKLDAAQLDTLIVLNERLKSKEEELLQQEKELRKKHGEMQRMRMQMVMRDEKNLELLTTAERLKQRLSQAELQNQHLASKVQETTLVLDKTKSDAQTINQQTGMVQQQAKQSITAMQDAEKRLQEQTQLGRRLETQINEQKKELASLTKELQQSQQTLTKTLEEKYQNQEKQAAAAQEREMILAKLEMEKVDLKTQNQEMKRLLAELEELNQGQKQVLQQQQQLINDLSKKSDQKQQLQNVQKLADQQVALLKQEKDDLQRRHQETQKNLSQQTSRIESLQAAISAMPKPDDWKQLQKQLKTREMELRQQSGLIEKLRQPGDQVEMLLETTKELYATVAKANQAAATADEANQEMRKLSDEVAEQNQKLRQELAGRQKELNNEKAELRKLQAEKLAAEAETAAINAKIKMEQENGAKLEALAKEWQEKFQQQSRKAIAMEEAVEKMRQEQKFLLAKTEVVDGLSKTLADATLEGQQALQRVSAMQTELEVLRDRNLDLEQQTKKQSELLTKLQAAPQGAEAWVTQLQEMNRQLEKETQRRKALETALVEMENKPASKHATAATTSAAAAIAPGGDQDSDTVQARENRIRYEQERVAVIRGFLRQGLDAEKQAKIEAAQWNYQKVLELESDNAFALQRLGILAANSGNDLDTLRYLQQAFRQNPDDLDTLLALGFAQVRQSQADWAVSTLGRAVSLYPDSIDAARAYGIALLTMGWTQAAETQLKKTITMKPEDAETAFNLAVLLATETPPRIPEAAKWYAKAVKNGAQPDPGLDAVLGTKNAEK